MIIRYLYFFYFLLFYQSHTWHRILMFPKGLQTLCFMQHHLSINLSLLLPSPRTPSALKSSSSQPAGLALLPPLCFSSAGASSILMLIENISTTQVFPQIINVNVVVPKEYMKLQYCTP